MLKNNFIKNTLDKVLLDSNAVYKSIIIQNSKSSGHFYRYTNASLENDSDYQNFILTSGLKFNKSEIEVNLNKEESLILLSTMPRWPNGTAQILNKLEA